jgi:hypothetical protein
MQTVHKHVLDEYLKRLSESKSFDSKKLEQLKKGLTGAKVRVDELVAIFSAPTGSDL